MTARESSESVPFIQDNKGFFNSSPPPAYLWALSLPAGPLDEAHAWACARGAGSCTAPLGQGSCQGRPAVGRAVDVFKRASGEQDLLGILKSMAGWWKEGFP